MIGTFYILSDGPIFFPVVSAELKRHQPGARTVHLQTREDLAALDHRDCAGARLIGFLTGTIVPAAVLGMMGFDAYNFHPGPPDLPGWRPVSFAVYHGLTRFGVTAHAMVPAVDAGGIVGTVMFDVPPGTGEAGLNNRMVLAVLHLLRLLAPDLATRIGPLTTLRAAWGPRRCTRRQAAALCDIPIGLEAGEIDRRIRAFGVGPPEGRPRILLHGHAFIVETDRREADAPMPRDMAMAAMLGPRR